MEGAIYSEGAPCCRVHPSDQSDRTDEAHRGSRGELSPGRLAPRAPHARRLGD